MNEGQPGPEQKTDEKGLYFKPYLMAERIREFKKKYNATNPSPGAERKEEMLEQYQLFKEKRADIREMILGNLDRLNEDPQVALNNATKAMENAQKDFERGQRDDNYVLTKQAKNHWQIASDFYQLLSIDEQTWQDMELANEDEGFELGELKNPQ